MGYKQLTFPKESVFLVTGGAGFIGSNAHHEIEAIFKAVAHAMKIAVSKNVDGSVLSTKGVL